MSRLAIIGAGGHAKVVIATAVSSGWSIDGVFDDARARWDEPLLGVRITGPTAPVLLDPSAIAVLAIGDNGTRARLARAARCSFARVVHPTACIHESVSTGEGSVVFAGAVVQPSCRLGRHVVVNTACSIDHDCEIGDFVHVGPGAHLAGSVRVQESAFIGIGAVVVPGVTIGRGTIVGAGAAVIADLPAHVVAVGVPARVVRRYS